MDGTSWLFFEDSRRPKSLDLRLRNERDKNGCYSIELIVHQKSHRDSSDMPHLTVLGKGVVGDDDNNELLDFSEEEALGLGNVVDEDSESDEGTVIDKDRDSDEGTVIDELTDIEELSD
ncbi:hypothetical protein IMSHALPRED_002986 [Imshaugia aleurites]|uniref:Uncharacterized protein n=1 Tax=Imshaugia aleurites TaxID=172621 RepID=A0A8H3I5X6_9LECA|nr:hypothetical protein IMSHALPRED_002986 [Imshaugia aleurites]